ncbi:hypothetical protein DUNSADRAFT_7185 [Dunaliella salina]|uniref:Phytanoyl-CoA dioxygenase n=1 Tax=Dunaliella salina TaxID=3046 RepID=A0ABQ7GLU8_DUNSA|nr:hypothetical protein DUNSADRAFT_7185 [Dunaliella salina]|eukprot:KAF5835583.1 hypothetical protein DUNSADRAFT_7185 [Dunaliella salina]
MALSPEQVQKFKEDGFLVLPSWSSREECGQLKARMDQLLQDFNPEAVRSIFTTKGDQTAITNEYFLNSSSGISFFLEEKAFDEATGKLKQAKELSVNKVGHALHDLDPTFRAFSRSERVASLLASLGYKVPLPVQSMYIFKQPRIGGEVVPHQDSTFLYTEPMTTVGLWWALEDCTKENGCLWAQPGIHKQGLSRRFSIREDKTSTFDKPKVEYDLSRFVPLECPAGSLVLLHGENVHYSAENTSDISRHSYSMHVVEGASPCKYPADNWLQRPQEMPFEPMYES